MFYGKSMTYGPTLRKDLRLIERITSFIQSCIKSLSAAQVETADPPKPELTQGAASSSPVPPNWRFPWERGDELRPALRLSFVSGALAVRASRKQAKALALVLAAALVLGTAAIAQAQQEVAPDHFDEPPALYVPARNLSTRKSHLANHTAGRRSRLTSRAHRTSQARDGKARSRSAS
jgi:hypothetical protein